MAWILMYVLLALAIPASAARPPEKKMADADEVEELYDRLDQSEKVNADLREQNEKLIAQMAEMSSILVQLKDAVAQQQRAAAELDSIKKEEKKWQKDRAHITSLPEYQQGVAKGNKSLATAAGEAERQRLEAEAKEIGKDAAVTVEIIEQVSAEDRERQRLQAERKSKEVQLANNPNLAEELRPLIDLIWQHGQSGKPMRERKHYKTEHGFWQLVGAYAYADCVNRDCFLPAWARVNPQSYMNRKAAEARSNESMFRETYGVSMWRGWRLLIDHKPELFPN